MSVDHDAASQRPACGHGAVRSSRDDQPSICPSAPSRAAVLHAALPAMGRYSHQPGKNHCCLKADPVPAGTPSGRMTPLSAHALSPPFAALTMGRTSFPGGSLGPLGVRANLTGTVVALAAPDKRIALLGSSQTCPRANSADESAVSHGVRLGNLRRKRNRAQTYPRLFIATS